MCGAQGQVIVLPTPPASHGFLQSLDVAERLAVLAMHDEFVVAAQNATALVRCAEKERAREKVRHKKRPRGGYDAIDGDDEYRTLSLSLSVSAELRQSVHHKYMQCLQHLYLSHDVRGAAGGAVLSALSRDIFRSLTVAAAVRGGGAERERDLVVSFTGAHRVHAGFERVFALCPDSVTLFNGVQGVALADGRTSFRYGFVFSCTLSMLLPVERETERARERQRGRKRELGECSSSDECESDNNSVCVSCDSTSSEDRSVCLFAHGDPQETLSLQQVRVELSGFNQSMMDRDGRMVSSVDRFTRIECLSNRNVTADQVLRALGYQ